MRLFGRPEPVEAIAEVPDGPPARFRWRRVLHEVAVAEGPERIAMEWWRDADGQVLTRDYFRVESREGLRVWLYREGLYGRETPAPRWFFTESSDDDEIVQAFARVSLHDSNYII